MKRRLLPEGMTRTPKAVSLPSWISYAALRGLSALTRASVRVDLVIHLLPVAVAVGERRVAQSVPPRQNVEKETTLFQLVSTEGACFGVSVSSVLKWVARYRATGSVAAGKVGGHRPWRLEPHRELLHTLVAETPHLTIDRLRERLAAAGIAVSRDTIWRFLKREGLSFKKNSVRD